MTTAPAPRQVLHAEQEHGGIRLAVFLGLFVAYVLGFWVVTWLLDAFAPPGLADYATFISCVGAVPLALLAIWVLENWLKRVWHSGLSLMLDANGLYVEDRRDGGKPLDPSDPPTIAWNRPSSRLNWYFHLSGYPRGGRERRLPKNWTCVCTEFQQDDERLSVFAFMPPARSAAWTGAEGSATAFHEIHPAEIYDNSIRSRVGPPSRPTIPNSLLHSKDGRYWLAERRRWEIGIELTPEDFTRLLSQAQLAATTLAPADH